MALTKITSNVLAANSVDSDSYVDGSIENIHLAANSVDSDNYVDGSIDLVHLSTNSVDGTKIVDDSISYEKIDNEFTTSSVLTAGATVDVDFDVAQVFTLTPTSNTTLNITNQKVGITKAIIVTGAGSSYTLAFTVGGASGTFNLIAGEYDDTSSTKNFIQILCVSSTEFWYSISQIAV